MEYTKDGMSIKLDIHIKDLCLVRPLGTSASDKLFGGSLDGVQLTDGLDSILQQYFA